MMATRTMASPASKPRAMLTVLSARTTGLPNPSAPTRAAITTIDKDSMMHWVSPAMIVGMACGSSTFHSSCERLAPKLRPASSSGFGTLLIMHVDLADWENTKRSYELFASEVIPHFRRRNVARQASLQFAQDNSEVLIGNLVGAITKAYTDYYGQPTDLPATPAPTTELNTAGAHA